MPEAQSGAAQRAGVEGTTLPRTTLGSDAPKPGGTQSADPSAALTEHRGGASGTTARIDHFARAGIVRTVVEVLLSVPSQLLLSALSRRPHPCGSRLANQDRAAASARSPSVPTTLNGFSWAGTCSASD